MAETSVENLPVVGRIASRMKEKFDRYQNPVATAKEKAYQEMIYHLAIMNSTNKFEESVKENFEKFTQGFENFSKTVRDSSKDMNVDWKQDIVHRALNFIGAGFGGWATGSAFMSMPETGLIGYALTAGAATATGLLLRKGLLGLTGEQHDMTLTEARNQLEDWSKYTNPDDALRGIDDVVKKITELEIPQPQIHFMFTEAEFGKVWGNVKGFFSKIRNSFKN